MPDDFPRLLTPQQAAELFPVFNADWIRQRLRAGELRGYQLGGRWLISIEDLSNFVQEHSSTPPRRRPRRRRS